MTNDSTRCARCEELPSSDPFAGRLYLWFPVWHTLMKTTRLLNRLDAEHEVLAERAGVVVELGDERLIDKIAGELGEHELTGTRALVVASGEVPSLDDFPRVSSLAELLAQRQGRWLIDLLREARLTTYFQPIFEAGGERRLLGHEALLRGRGTASETIPAGQILTAAREADLLFPVDAAARRTAIHRAAEVELEGLLFINFSPASIYDPVFCLRSTDKAVAATGRSPSSIVFEITESAGVDNPKHLESLLAWYREHGFRVALDDLGAGYSSLNLLHRLRPDFVKLDRELIDGVDQDPLKAAIASRALQLATDLGTISIVEGIESQGELDWAAAHGAQYAQGYHLGRPGLHPVRSPLVAL